MHIEFLVEEQSAEAALYNLIPTILGNNIEFTVHPFQGKSDLLANLPSRLKGYGSWLPEDWRIVVLMDSDNQDCRILKSQLEDIAGKAGLITKTAAGDSRFQVLNRLAIEELEAWLLGDVEALRAAYPRVSKHLAQKEKYRDPDAIAGGTWEAMEKVLQNAGYHKGGLPKVTAAREISRHMNPEVNRSRSFQVFRQGLMEMVA